MAWPDTIDMGSDYLVWNNTETVRYFSKQEEDPNATGFETVTNTLWHSIRKDRLPADSILIKMDLTVNLPVATLGDIVPKMDDIMVREDGTRWIVKLVEFVAEESSYRVRVIRSLKAG